MFIVPQSLSTTNRVVELIFWVIVSPIIFAALALVLLLWLVAYLTTRLTGLITSRHNFVSPGDMRVPTFYSSMSKRTDERAGVALALMSIAGVVFGGIHCTRWLFISPSGLSANANQTSILWRVSSGVLTGITFLSHHDDIFHLGLVIRFKIAGFGAVLLVLIFVLSRWIGWISLTRGPNASSLVLHKVQRCLPKPTC